MSQPTVRPNLGDHLLRISRKAEELRNKLERYRETLQRAQLDLPIGVLDQLRQISGTLVELQQEADAHEQERRNLQALSEIGQVVNSSLDLQTVLNEVMDTIIQLTGAERAFLMMRDEDSQEMETLAARNWERVSLDEEEIQVSDTIVGQVVTSGDAVLTTNAQTDPRFDKQESIVSFSLRSILCVPLNVKGKLIGVIYADNRAREGLFKERERKLLLDFANQAAVALENARLFDSVKRSLDEVSELKNLMEDVFNSIVSGVLTSDIEDAITLCNRAAENILATTQEVLLGTSLRQQLAALSDDLSSKVDQVESKDVRFRGVEVRTQIEDRGEVDLSLNLSPLKTAEDATRGVAIVLDDLTEKRRLEAQRRLFERMVSPAVIDQLDPDAIQLGGHRAQITTFFADIRGFTAFSEKKKPERLVAVLNRFLAAAADAILHEEGTIDKFLGDAVMAWFNAPIPQKDHTLRAVRAAIALKSSVEALHQELPEEMHLSFGIGIHAGEALLGLVGTQQRVEYTAIGDCVNTAKRLQENAAAGQILISRQTAKSILKSIEVVDVAPVVAEGKANPIEVYEVVGLH